jgi:hypothetical protein
MDSVRIGQRTNEAAESAAVAAPGQNHVGAVVTARMDG